MIQTVNALPLTQFNQLTRALNQSSQQIDEDRVHSDRGTPLLAWVESPKGCSFTEFEATLNRTVTLAGHTAERFRALVLNKNRGPLTQAEVQDIVQHLRGKIGDDSLDVAFFEPDHLRVVLRGSQAGLRTLEDLFESSELEDLNMPPIKQLQLVQLQLVQLSSTTARKARLAETLRLRYPLVHILNVTKALARVIARARALNLDLVRNLDLARDLDPNIRIDLTEARALANAINGDLAHTRARTGAIARATYFVQDALLDLGYLDLSGVNLTNIYLVGINLTGSELAHTMVEGAVFGNNPGLSEADKTELQRRGAIFQTSPGYI